MVAKLEMVAKISHNSSITQKQNMSFLASILGSFEQFDIFLCTAGGGLRLLVGEFCEIVSAMHCSKRAGVEGSFTK